MRRDSSPGSPPRAARQRPTSIRRCRIKLGELAQIAEMHVRDLTGFDGPSPEVLPVTSGAWAQRTLEAYRPLFTELATSLGQPAAQPRHRHRSQRRPDDGDDGQPQQDDGPVDDGNGGRLDGRAHGHPGLRAARPADPSPRCQHHGAARQHRSVRRGVEHLRRRDANVGAGSRAHRARACSRSPRSAKTLPRWCAATSALSAGPRGNRREALLARRRGRRSHPGHATGIR